MTNRRLTRDVGVNRGVLTPGRTEKGGTNPVPSQITARPPPPPPMTPQRSAPSESSQGGSGSRAPNSR